MKEETAMEKPIRTIAACALAMLLAVRPATAAPPARDISAEIGALRGDIVSAKVYRLSNSTSIRYTQHEEDVSKDCFYAASGDDLSALLGVLVAGRLHETNPNPGFEVRTIVYLATRDGSTIPLLLDTHLTGMPTHGSYDHRIPVGADNAFSTALDAWTSSRTPINPETSQYCIGSITNIQIR